MRADRRDSCNGWTVLSTATLAPQSLCCWMVLCTCVVIVAVVPQKVLGWSSNLVWRSISFANVMPAGDDATDPEYAANNGDDDDDDLSSCCFGSCPSSSIDVVVNVAVATGVVIFVEAVMALCSVSLYSITMVVVDVHENIDVLLSCGDWL